MTQMLEQARKGIKALIDESPSLITILRRSYTDNGLGGRVFNMAEVPVAYKFKGRLIHSAPNVQRNTDAPAGSDTSFSMFLLASHNVEFFEGETFTLYGSTWTIGAVEIIQRLGGKIAIQAALTRGTI